MLGDRSHCGMHDICATSPAVCIAKAVAELTISTMLLWYRWYLAGFGALSQFVLVRCRVSTEDAARMLLDQFGLPEPEHNLFSLSGAPVDGMLPMLTEATIRQITDLNLMDQKGHPIPLEAKLRLLRFLRVTALTLRYRRHLPLDLHSKVSADSVSAMFLCYLLFHSVRPDTYLKGPCPAECLYAHPKQIAGMLSGSNKEVAQALSCKAFCSSSTKLAQSMVYPQHIWDQRNFVCCFQAMLDHIQHQMVAESGAWRLSTPWGQWQAMPTYARHLQSNPLGAFGDVLGLMQNLGKPIDIY